MSYHGRLLCIVVAFLTLVAGRAVAENPIEDGTSWLRWNGETRTAYVSGYLWGLGRGFRDGCQVGQKAYLTGKVRGLPGEKCIPKQPNFSRNLEDYVGGITKYYSAYPADSYVPIFNVLEGLSDARKLSITQMHEYYSSSSRKPQETVH